jgi:hypothetical protein
MLFLEELILNLSGNLTNFEPVAGEIAALAIFSIVLLVFTLVFTVIVAGLYIYASLAFVAIAKRLKRKDGNIAWIPFVGKLILAARISKKKAWSLWFYLSFLLIPFMFFGNLGFNIFAVIFIVFSVIFITVFSIIWHWKMFEAVNRPGWWILLIFVPQVGGILYYVFLGIAAWGGEDKIEKRKDGK